MEMEKVFDINIWNYYRTEVMKIGEILNANKDNDGNFIISPHRLQYHLANMNKLLKECSMYLDECGLRMTRNPD